MKFENTIVTGFENAILGMRLPMCQNLTEAKEKSDSSFDKGFIYIGEQDLRIMKNLIKADTNGGSQPNSKFLRMIHVQVAITAPLYYFKEIDTYKVGTTANSTSTMHKLASTPITKECFEMDDFAEDNYDYPFLGIEFEDSDGNFDCDNLTCVWEDLIVKLEQLRIKYNETKDKRYWKELIRILPESWLQTRMFDCDYATLRNIYRWRHNHKLTEWHQFCDWILTLPYAKELLVNE